MRLLWAMLYAPMAVVWVGVCLLHALAVGILRALDWVTLQLYPGIMAVARRADGLTDDDDDDLAGS